MKAAPVAFLKITLREKLYSLFFCNFQRARIKRYLLVLLITFPPRHLTETIVDIFAGYLFVGVLILYMQDSSVKRGYHIQPRDKECCEP